MRVNSLLDGVAVEICAKLYEMIPRGQISEGLCLTVAVGWCLPKKVTNVAIYVYSYGDEYEIYSAEVVEMYHR